MLLNRIGSCARRGVVVAVVSCLLGAAVSSVPAGAVSAQLALTPPRVRVEPAATIRARGAAAVVALDVACPGRPVDHLEVDVEQTAADGTTTASAGYATIPHCGPSSQRVLAPLQGNYCTENSFCGTLAPIHSGSATVGVYYYDCSGSTCKDHLYPRRRVALSYNAGLDQRASSSLALARSGHLTAHRTAAYVYLRTTCTAADPGAGAGQISLTQNVAGSVTYAQFPGSALPACTSGPPRWSRILMQGGPLTPGSAYVLVDNLFALVTLR